MSSLWYPPVNGGEVAFQVVAVDLQERSCTPFSVEYNWRSDSVDHREQVNT